MIFRARGSLHPRPSRWTLGGLVLVALGGAFFLIERGGVGGLGRTQLLLAALSAAFFADALLVALLSHDVKATRNRVLGGIFLLGIAWVTTVEVPGWPLLLVLVGILLLVRGLSRSGE